MRFLVDRLREPGTLRSLAVVLFGLWGVAPSDPVVEAAIQIGIILLGLVSAVMPEKTSEAAEAVAQAAGAARETAAKAAVAASEAKAATSQATQLVGSARALAEAANVRMLPSQPGPGPEYMGR
ncbi:hypothetical protein [Pseudoroseomonas cervicalis]|uniref:hypothetical protein n=1 Tax=Teichococcus cervicalis TaxID=204525 RepID=UPI00278931BA|nr:hypothetical protein [Pseudoroseomonas cervicalis]MDQ1078019.1 hypothetical protein [Pseudoroseomonas cervicalis]MDQ1081460.1 hypothetical protein [Pseudoroseomonas cervicalis]